MTKILPLLAVALMLLHLIKPIGIAGLRERRDFWKIAIVMIAATLVTAMFHQW